MSARAVARVTISFGLAQIGIKLYLAACEEHVSFNMINPETKNRVKQMLVDEVTRKEVERGNLLKGFEYAKDQYVCFTEQEMENMHASKRDTLEIVEFVPDSEVDPLHVEKTYYTGPDKGMDKGYKFLFEILKAYKRVAIGTWVSRGKEHLVAIRAHQHGLIMHQMFYNTEIRAFENKCSDVPISPVEMAMGKVLMDTLFHEKLDESKYRDKFIDKLMAAVQVKIDGGNIKEDSAPVVNSNITDALRSSLLAMGIKADQIDGMLKAQGIQESAEPFVLTAPKAKRTRTRKAS